MQLPSRSGSEGRAADLLVKAGGAVVGLAGDDPEWLRSAERRYEGFRAPAPADWSVRYEVRSPSARATGEAGLVREGDAPVFTLRGTSILGHVDVRRRRLRVEGPRPIGALDALLRYVMPSIVKDGLVLHGCGVVVEGRGFACAGPSGSGKSTLARLVGERAVCDELVAARLVGDRWLLDALPYWNARPACVPLAAVCLLRHGERNERTRLGEAGALRLLAANVLWPTYSPSETEARFGLLADLVSRVPVFDLAFVPTEAVLGELTREPA